MCDVSHESCCRSVRTVLARDTSAARPPPPLVLKPPRAEITGGLEKSLEGARTASAPVLVHTLRVEGRHLRRRTSVPVQHQGSSLPLRVALENGHQPVECRGAWVCTYTVAAWVHAVAAWVHAVAAWVHAVAAWVHAVAAWVHAVAAWAHTATARWACVLLTVAQVSARVDGVSHEVLELLVLREAALL